MSYSGPQTQANWNVKKKYESVDGNSKEIVANPIKCIFPVYPPIDLNPINWRAQEKCYKHTISDFIYPYRRRNDKNKIEVNKINNVSKNSNSESINEEVTLPVEERQCCPKNSIKLHHHNVPDLTSSLSDTSIEPHIIPIHIEPYYKNEITNKLYSTQSLRNRTHSVPNDSTICKNVEPDSSIKNGSPEKSGFINIYGSQSMGNQRKCYCRTITAETRSEIVDDNRPTTLYEKTELGYDLQKIRFNKLPSKLPVKLKFEKDEAGKKHDKRDIKKRGKNEKKRDIRKKPPIKRPMEKKVDDVHPSYTELVKGEKLDKKEYQKHYNLILRGPSRIAGLKFDPCIVYRLGEKGSGLRARGEVQDFYKLRDENLSNGTLFEDPDFPPNDSSLYYSQRADRYYEWKRPHEICDNPQLFVEGYSRFDVQQGELGDCWLLAAVANLTLYRRLFFQVVPEDQGFEDKYAGIFHFRFWQYGRWIDVVIDDKLPTYRGQLIFLHSTEDNEFWSALLEKAYAKLHGSYEALKGGSTCEAMEDFTGGVTEMYEMNASPPNLFKIVHKAYERSSLMGCSLEPDPNVLEAETPEGLIRGHAYSITRVKYVDIQTPNTIGKIPLLRLRNPWGNETEWKGAWSDESPEWRFISEHEKEELGLTFDDDGEFWMSFKDFQQHFDRLEICNLNPDSLTEEEIQEGNKKRWEVSFFEGEWVRGVTGGGCRNYLNTFWHNPQYRITLTEVDEGDDDGKCTLIVALMQKNRRSQRNMGIDVLTIGFAIYHLPYPDSAPKPLDLNFFKYNASVARSPSFINLREVSCRFKLPPGTYCIVPSTFEPNEEGEFLLRVFSENKNNMEENDEEIGYGEVDPRAHIEIPLKAPAELGMFHEIKDVEPTPDQSQQVDKVYEFFLKLAGDDQEVDWMELKDILDYAMRQETQNKGFSKDVCRSMVAMLDEDHSGKLGFEEFKTLWVDIREWKNCFRLYDRDQSGSLSGYELRQALNSAGYHLNNHILNILMHRYGNKNGVLEFDDFIMCAVKLKTMIDIFKSKDPENTNIATFTMEEWIEKTLYS